MILASQAGGIKEGRHCLRSKLGEPAMLYSLSVRVAEQFQSKERASMSLEEVADLAHSAGFEALCMRASQVGVGSTRERVVAASRGLAERGLSVSMVTGDFDIVYNNDRGPSCLRNIAPYVELARELGAPLLRVALKTDDDIVWAQRAADAAAKSHVRLAHQCHTLSLFETVDGIERTLRRINRASFGLIYEPANLQLCGQDYGPDTIERLAPWIFNVYLQNHTLKPDGKITLNTWCRGEVSFDSTPIHEQGSIDFDRVIRGLKHIGYHGTITVHQAAREGEMIADSVKATADFLREKMRDGGSSQRWGPLPF
jgi:sugar phosphate isomerase/epimerase